MAKTANINIRIEPDVKAEAEQLFSSFGITISDAVNIFIRKSLMQGGIPFSVVKPRFNKETEEAMKEALAIEKGEVPAKHYKNTDELFAEMGIDV